MNKYIQYIYKKMIVFQYQKNDIINLYYYKYLQRVGKLEAMISYGVQYLYYAK